MYTPGSFREDDPAVLFQLMKDHPFATLIGQGEDGLVATHLPFRIEPERGAGGTLVAHMARANPHWRAFRSGGEVLVTFLGPHAYISPAWYTQKVTVPTWNYAAVHVYGVPRIVNDPGVLRAQVEQLVRAHEAYVSPPWDMASAEPIMESELRAIVGFEIPIARMEGKFKFNQNRSVEDRRGVVAALETEVDPRLRAVAEIMRRSLPPL